MDAQDEHEAIMDDMDERGLLIEGGHRGEPSRGAVRRALVKTWTSGRTCLELGRR